MVRPVPGLQSAAVGIGVAKYVCERNLKESELPRAGEPIESRSRSA